MMMATTGTSAARATVTATTTEPKSQSRPTVAALRQLPRPAPRCCWPLPRGSGSLSRAPGSPLTCQRHRRFCLRRGRTKRKKKETQKTQWRKRRFPPPPRLSRSPPARPLSRSSRPCARETLQRCSPRRARPVSPLPPAPLPSLLPAPPLGRRLPPPPRSPRGSAAVAARPR